MGAGMTDSVAAARSCPSTRMDVGAVEGAPLLTGLASPRNATQ